jgi:hypothetical protein
MKKETIVMATEILGGIIACIGIGMFSVATSLIVAGALVITACEANS